MTGPGLQKKLPSISHIKAALFHEAIFHIQGWKTARKILGLFPHNYLCEKNLEFFHK